MSRTDGERTVLSAGDPTCTTPPASGQGTSATQVLLAVDAMNHFLDARQHGKYLDLTALLEFARQIGDLRHANLYTDRSRDERDHNFLVAAKLMGFTNVVAEYPLVRADGTQKSAADLAIAMDVWAACVRAEVSHVVLATGDSDFAGMVRRIVQTGIAVHVIGPDHSTAWELVVAATTFRYASEVPGLLASTPAWQVAGPLSHPGRVVRPDRPSEGTLPLVGREPLLPAPSVPVCVNVPATQKPGC
jgi:uncharacterized LabA/DUF88 family protein